jgi:predicted TIM-barrel fold metal-dependent hydrolase
VIDGHLHLLPPDLDDTLRRFDESGVAAGIAVGVAEADDYLDHALQRHPDRFVGIAAAPPPGDDIVAVMTGRQARAGYGGVRVTSPGHPGEAGYRPLYRWLAARGLALWSHARGPSDLRDLGRLARRFPDLPIVLEHLGLTAGMSLAEQAGHVGSLAGCPNIRLMVSGTYALEGAGIARIIGDLVTLYGPSRCMWASDWPFSSGRLSYPQTIEVIAEALPFLGTAELDMVFGGTAAHLFPGLCHN